MARLQRLRPRRPSLSWFKDKLGVSLQVVTRELARMLKDPNSAGANRAMAAGMGMKKFDLAALQMAFEG